LMLIDRATPRGSRESADAPQPPARDLHWDGMEAIVPERLATYRT
jgi:hypothetical protein